VRLERLHLVVTKFVSNEGRMALSLLKGHL